MSFSNVTGPIDQDRNNGISEPDQEVSSSKNDFMDTDIQSGNQETNDQQEIVSISKAHHHLLRISFPEQNESALNESYGKIKRFIFEELKINLLSLKLNPSKCSMHLATETEDEASRISTSRFQDIGIQAECKVLTKNVELDAKKVKIFRRSKFRVDIDQFKQCVAKYGSIEEMYEIKNYPNKRTFIVAFGDINSKVALMKEKTIFIGSNLYEIENFVAGPRPESNSAVPKRFTLRISNIRNTNTDFSVKNLMTKMKATSWHIPIAKCGIKMPVIIAVLDNENDFNKALKTSWTFDGQQVFVSNIEENVCFKCGEMNHVMKECPMNAWKVRINTERATSKKNIPTMVFPSLEAYKVESTKLIEKHTENRDKEIEAFRRELAETNKKLQLLEHENMEIKQEIRNNQARTSMLIEEMMIKHVEFANNQASLMEKINSSEKSNEVRHNQILEFLQTLKFGEKGPSQAAAEIQKTKMNLRKPNGTV